jgi:hypothetical protein
MGNRTLPVMLAGLLTFGTLLISARNEPRLTLPTVGPANFYINNCSDLRSLQPFRTTGAPSPSARTVLFATSETSS